jgi:hypothetical protein
MPDDPSFLTLPPHAAARRLDAELIEFGHHPHSIDPEMQWTFQGRMNFPVAMSVSAVVLI